MNNWWKAGLLGAGALGLTALTGGAAAGPLAGLLGSAGEASAAGGGLALAGEGAAAAAPAAEVAGAATTAAPGATAFVTQPVTGMLAGAGDLSGTLAGTDLAYGTPAALAEAPSAAPSALQQGMEYAKMGGKAASAYGTVQQGIGMGSQPHAAPPPARPVFQGEAAPIAPNMPHMGAKEALFAMPGLAAGTVLHKAFGGGLMGAAPGAQPGMAGAPQNQFAQMLLAQRQRGMLG